MRFAQAKLGQMHQHMLQEKKLQKYCGSPGPGKSLNRLQKNAFGKLGRKRGTYIT